MISRILALFTILAPLNVLAVRPFVTDDARIVSKGQFEIESWPELNFVGDEQNLALQFMGGYSFTEWFELIMGTGLGHDRDHNNLTTANPVISSKFLFYKSVLNSWVPGLGLNLGSTINYGHGELYEESSSYFGFLVATWRLKDDWVNIHVNLGSKSSRVDKKNYAREFWGVGFDLGVVNRDYRAIFEAYAGDPFDSIASRIAYQAGIRWIKSEHVNLDFTGGTQKEVITFHKSSNRNEYWIQAGIRILFDTPYTVNPSHDGAEGLFKR